MEDLKDKATNLGGVLILVAGMVGSMVTAGVALPAMIITGAAISGSVGAAIISFFTGKNADGTKKSVEQIELQKKKV